MFVVPYILVIYMFNSGPTICTLYSLFLSSLALHVSGAICNHHQEDFNLNVDIWGLDRRKKKEDTEIYTSGIKIENLICYICAFKNYKFEKSWKF
jgi:hypothetical protein